MSHSSQVDEAFTSQLLEVAVGRDQTTLRTRRDICCAYSVLVLKHERCHSSQQLETRFLSYARHVTAPSRLGLSPADYLTVHPQQDLHPGSYAAPPRTPSRAPRSRGA